MANRVHEGNEKLTVMINSYVDLCSYEDVDFINRAYMVILNRLPDTSGERYYRSLLRAGYSKTYIVDRLYRSSENARVVEPLVGLVAKLQKHRRASTLGLGWLYRLFGYTEGNSRGERRDRAFLRELAGIRHEMVYITTGLQLVASAVPMQHGVADASSPPTPDVPIAIRGTQSLASAGQEFLLPLSTDSHTRRLIEVLEREILFTTRSA